MIPENTDTPLKADCPSSHGFPYSLTPETDIEQLLPQYLGNIVSAAFARKLERERDEALHQMEKYAAEAKLAIAAHESAFCERDEARNQRDRLAEALRKAISWGDSASHYIRHRQNINWTYLNEAKEALQSLNQPKKYDAKDHASFYP